MGGGGEGREERKVFLRVNGLLTTQQEKGKERCGK